MSARAAAAGKERGFPSKSCGNSARNFQMCQRPVFCKPYGKRIETTGLSTAHHLKAVVFRHDKREDYFMKGEIFMTIKPSKNQTMVGNGVGFDRIRRITGYLVGTVDRFNNAKRAEERDRVKHGV